MSGGFSVMYDPAWDMPKQNWQQQGSFEVGEIPPTTEPDDAPLVCLPSINESWLPYVMGALDQLRNPSSWLVADDDAMYNTLARVTKLREMIGVRAACVMYQLRYDAASCQLQYSTDGGSTWVEVDGWSGLVPCLPPQTDLQFTDTCELQISFDENATWAPVAGWDENFGNCVQDNVPIIGLPPNPGDQPSDEFACSIAAYLANEVILQALTAAVNAIQDDLTLLSFGNSVLTLIPEFILVKAFVEGVSTIYAAVSEGTLSDYQDAIADPTLWQNVTCAIFGAIRADGRVTPGNFGAIVTNIGGIVYTHTDVIDALVDYVNKTGATGLAQLSQGAGLLAGADCSACPAPWCKSWTFTEANYTDWLRGSYGTWALGEGWGTDLYSVDFQALQIVASVPFSTRITGVRVIGTVGAGNSNPLPVGTVAVGSSGDTGYLATAVGDFDTTIDFDELNPSEVSVRLSSGPPPADKNWIQEVQVFGEGPNPWAPDNC